MPQPLRTYKYGATMQTRHDTLAAYFDGDGATARVRFIMFSVAAVRYVCNFAPTEKAVVCAEVCAVCPPAVKSMQPKKNDRPRRESSLKKEHPPALASQGCHTCCRRHMASFGAMKIIVIPHGRLALVRPDTRKPARAKLEKNETFPAWLYYDVAVCSPAEK